MQGGRYRAGVTDLRPASRASVLLVEDDGIIREAICRTLVDRGYAVVAAPGGTEGLEAIRTHPVFHLAILDFKLPGLSGSQLLRYLEQESPQTEVIVISGYSTAEIRVDAVAHGAFTVLEKPFAIPTLINLVDRLLAPMRPIP